ncbi:LPXTG cell wall anchor domain-containing protein [Agrococcus sp. SL85]|uniref:Ig-like domain-containing protein n=1 Tax=Agrococcus sp. SL85 TaxID=2995141 RepID=UPI00226CA06A|nr:LPXTG cell wall anchor domain-containing protein [Agrococcus sp. SL85]WAC66827.1 LPXTG cell wall anchor domain-containing protein [Agrococcus sp. SL85]
MRHAADRSSSRRALTGAKRLLAGALSTLLVAGGLVAVSVTAPTAANAAPPLNAAGFVYATAGKDVYRINTASGAATLVTTAGGTTIAPSPAQVTTINQLAISTSPTSPAARGATAFWIERQVRTGQTEFQLVEYDLATETRTNTTTVPNDGIGGQTMGGFDPATNSYVFGSMNGTTLNLRTYDAGTNTLSPTTISVTLEGAPGANGDLAFGNGGTLYVVAGAATESPGAQLYRVTGGITSGNLQVSPLGDAIPQQAVNSIAFGTDGYLYLGSNQGISRVHPSSGDRLPLSGGSASPTAVRAGATTLGVSDFASSATPYSVSAVIDQTPIEDPPGTPLPDEHVVTIGGGQIPDGGPGTTGGTENGTAGPVIVLPGDDIEVVQTPAPDNVTPDSDYAKAWTCTTRDGTVVSSGFGDTASFTVPERTDGIGENVTCQFTTVEAISQVELSKSASPDVVTAIGQTITYTLTASNTGNVPATGVTIADPMPGLSALSCTPAQPSTLNPGASMSCTATRPATAADFEGTGTISNTATLDYTTQQGDFDDTATEEVTPDRSAPAPVDDTEGPVAIGSPAVVDVVGNDGTVDPTTVRILPPGGGAPTTTYGVPGEGTWTVDPETGAITFTPEDGFSGDPTPIEYDVAGLNGVRASATVTVDYAPGAQDDQNEVPGTLGQPVTVPILDNDQGGAVPGTVALVDPTTGDPLAPGAPLVVDGEGTWTIDPATGDVTFTPAEGFEGDPTPVDYVVEDAQGNQATGTVTVVYAPEAQPDSLGAQVPGESATVDPLANDRGTVDPDTFAFVDPATGDPLAPGAPLTVPGEGQWTWVPGTGVVFVPEEGFLDDPTPVDYVVSGPGGETGSTIEIDYVSIAVDDADYGNTIGDDVVVPVLENDRGPFLPTSIELFDPATSTWLAAGETLVVPGEGQWVIDQAAGTVTFQPEDGFLVDPTIVQYRATDEDGATAEASIDVRYVPTTTDDVAVDPATGEDAVIGVDAVAPGVLANDTGVFDADSFRFVTPGTGALVEVLVVDGQGTWTYDAAADAATFSPAEGYEGDPSPVEYEVTDVTGDVVRGTISANYVPLAQDDLSSPNAIGETVTVDVLGNDGGELDEASLVLIDPVSGDPLAAGETVVVLGQGEWSVVGGQVVFTPIERYEGDPSPIRYQVADLSGDTTTAEVRVNVVPEVFPKTIVDGAIGEPVVVDILGDDRGADRGVLDPASVAIVDPTTGEPLAPGAQLVVPGEGVWTIDPSTGAITFTPEDGFEGDPTTIEYVVSDLSGDQVRTSLTVDYAPAAVADEDLGNTIGEAVEVDVLGNDVGVLDPTTVAIVDPATGEPLADGAPLVVPGEGEWTIDPATGAITFTPEAGFLVDPTIIEYVVRDRSGSLTSPVTVTVTYVPSTTDDVAVDPVTGEDALVGGIAVAAGVLGNDTGEFDATTFRFVTPGSGALVEQLVVEGEGTWSYDAETDSATFAPADGFEGDPTPVVYSITDVTGDTVTATISANYRPLGADDANATPGTIGQPVVIDVLANDAGDLDPATVAIVDPASGEPLAPGAQLVVPGEGVWTIDPATGAITFTPEDGFEGDPTPIDYVVEDRSGDVTGGRVTVDYAPTAQDDLVTEVDGQPIVPGTTVTVPVLANDAGALVPGSVAIIDPTTGEPLAPGAPLEVPGEGTWTVEPSTGDITFTPEEGFESDPTPIDYEVRDESGTPGRATVEIDYAQAAADDRSADTAIGQPVTIDVLANDTGDLVPGTVAIIDPATGEPLAPGAPLEVPGEGTWTVDPATGAITFTPEDGFEGDPTPIRYQVEDAAGDVVSAEVVANYLPEAQDDRSADTPIGQPVTIDVLANDAGGLVPGTVAIVDPTTGEPLAPGTPLEVPGEGTWTVDPATGAITFTPEDGFEADPTPIRYVVEDASGDVTGAEVVANYVPVAADDASTGNTIGEPVTIDVLENDASSLLPGTVAIIDPAAGEPLAVGAPLEVPGEGTWTVDPATGAITFTPEDGFTADPTPIEYQAADASGDTATATVTVGYVPVAADDRLDGNTIGAPAVVDVLANDQGGLLPGTVALIDPVTGEPQEPGAPLTVLGQGTWTIDPATGAITFTPIAGYEGDPSPVGYQAADASGETAQATVTVTYLPVAVDDESRGNAAGEPTTVDVLANDAGVLDPATVAIVDPATGEPLAPGAPLEVPGQGTWTIDPATGAITFTPAEGFQVDPTPIGYVVEDASGDRTGATVTVDYAAAALDDESFGNAIGTAVTVDALANDVGELDPATVALVDPATGEALPAGEALVVDGEGTWTIEPATGAITFTPADGFEGDPTPVDYQVTEASGEVLQATVTIGYLPIAVDDESLGNALGDAVTVDVLANDRGDLDPATVAIIDPATGEPLPAGQELVVPGEGTWTIDPATGAITFTPEAGYEGDPTPIGYQVEDRSGDVAQATVTVGYLATAIDDESLGNAIGEAVTVDVLANDGGDLDPASVAIIDPATGEPLAAGQELVVPGEGTWTVDPATGAITFTPEAGFEGDPTPIEYQVSDGSGDTDRATVTVGYLPVAADDAATAETIGQPVTVDVLANDRGDLDPATVAIIDPATGERLPAGQELVVPGQGTWTVDPATGAITFTPEAGFEGDPTPIGYEVEDRSGDPTRAEVSIDYPQAAADDESLGNTIGEAVTVDVLANDTGDLDPATVAIVDPATGAALPAGQPLAVAGEGVWTIDPATGAITFTPEEGFEGDPTPIGYQVADRSGDVVAATVTVDYTPVANDDESLANEQGTAVTVDVLANDTGAFDPASVRIVDGEELVTELVVPGEGTWTVDPATGAITFTPEAGFEGDPTPIAYQATDADGETAQATVTITYGATAVDDASLGNERGTAVTVPVLANDLGDFDPASVRIVDGEELVTELVVPGEGTWTVDPATGAITFTPEAGFEGDPTPIAYQATDATGDTARATVTITYLPQANDDASLDNAQGTSVTVDPLANDLGDLDPTTVELLDPATGEWGTTVVVDGEGTWTVDPATGAITFTPEADFEGDPTPIEYRVADRAGNRTSATVTVTYAAVGGQPEEPGEPGQPGQPGQPGGDDDDLPRTGGDVPLLVLALGMALTAAGALLLGRRRREV